jgi:diguanylate cyclase (GGDEF)-like protein
MPVTCGALICLTLLIDLATGAEHHVYALYFVPVALAAWFGGRVHWIVVALLSALVSVITYPILGGRFYSTAYMFANLLTQIAAYLAVGMLTEFVRRNNLQDAWLLQHDALTGLLNTTGFRDRLGEDLKIVRRYRRAWTVAYIDLDNFKLVNDRSGHRAGDQLLKSVASVMRSCLRDTDSAARLGGDEFALLLPETSAAGAHALLERLRCSLQHQLAGTHPGVTASIGALSFDDVPGDLDQLMAHADHQMYAAKRTGKNRVALTDLVDDG